MMMKQNLFHRVFPVAFVLLSLFGVPANGSTQAALIKSSPEVLFDHPGGFYQYAPTVIESQGVRHYWWCQNSDPYIIRDHIFYREQFHTDAGWTWTESKVALPPGAPGTWDSVHVCDPAVVEGRFRYGGVDYKYAMFYLGTDQLDNNHNQIGVAFAKEWSGPWVKYERNPIIKAESTSVWGVGQPSVTSVDGAGHMLLFFTKGDMSGTHLYRSELRFDDMTNPVIGEPVLLPEMGLSTKDGSPAFLHDADLVYDPSRDQFFMVAPQHPFDPEAPSFISSELQVATISGGSIWSGIGVWKVLGAVGPSDTGLPRNHDGCIVRTPFGTLPDPGEIVIDFSTAKTGPDSLWSYTLTQVRYKLSE